MNGRVDNIDSAELKPRSYLAERFCFKPTLHPDADKNSQKMRILTMSYIENAHISHLSLHRIYLNIPTQPHHVRHLARCKGG